MNQNSLNVLLDKIANIENRQHSLEVEFIDYAEKNPKADAQWVEQRLRALEAQIVLIKNNEDEDDCPDTVQDVMDRFFDYRQEFASQNNVLTTQVSYLLAEVNKYSELYKELDKLVVELRKEILELKNG